MSAHRSRAPRGHLNLNLHSMKIPALFATSFLTFAPLGLAQQPAEVPADVLAMVPDNSLLCVRLASLDALDAALASAGEIAGQPFPTIEQLLMENAPLDLSFLDHTRPILVCVTSFEALMGDEPPPAVAFVPTTDAAVALESLAPMLAPTGATGTDVGSGYVAYSTLPTGLTRGEGGAAFTGRLNPGLLSVAARMDESMIGQLQMAKFGVLMGKSAMVGEISNDPEVPEAVRPVLIEKGGAVFDFALELIDSLDSLSATLDLEGGVASLDFDAMMKPGSALAERSAEGRPSLAAFDAAIDPNAVVSLLLNFEFGGTLNELTDVVVDVAKAEMRNSPEPPNGWPSAWADQDDVVEDFGGALMHIGNALATLKSGVVLNFEGLDGLSAETELETFGRFEVWSAGASLGDMQAALAAVIGAPVFAKLGFTSETTRTDGQVTERLVFNTEQWAKVSEGDVGMTRGTEKLSAFFGTPREVVITQAGELVRIAMDGELPSRAPGLALRRAQANLGATPPVFALHTDLGAGMRLADLVAKADTGQSPFGELGALLLADLNVPAMLYAGFDGAHLKFGLTSDVADAGKLAALVAMSAEPMMPAETYSDETLMAFEYDVLPILAEKCTNCHGERRQKEGLRVDTFDGLMAGSEWGTVIAPGNADDSVLVQVIRAPLDDDMHMPPPNKPQLSASDIQTIADWVNAMK